ncbi:MAG: hypothetical protein JSU94_17925 [Phycisphaerales bacterium]|nr:MAG: hypothetical protein JSU94_17925 [Phycisphaerales bacterium]
MELESKSNAGGKTPSEPAVGALLATILWSVTACAVVAISSFTSSALGAGAEADSRDVLRALIETLRVSPGGYAAAGSASVFVEEDGNRIQRTIDFRFKDTMSRSDAYSPSNGKKGDLQVIWSVNRENSVAYNGRYATVKKKPFGQFFRSIAYDFHPDTFNQIQGTPLADILENVLKGAAQVNADLDKNGILNISAEFRYKDHEAAEHIKIALDTRHGYVLQSWQHQTRNLNGIGSAMDAQYGAEWKMTDNRWYVSKARFEENHTSVVHRGEAVEPKYVTYKAEVVVNDLVVDPEIPDSDFTLVGLGLPHDTLVVDDVVGVTYKYGSGIRGTAELEGPLLETRFFRTIKRQTGARDVGQHSSAGRETIDDGKQASQTHDAEPARKGLYIMVGIICLAGMVSAALLVFKSLRARKAN